MITLNVEVTPEFDELLCELASKTGMDMGRVLRNSIVLLSLAVEVARNGGNMTIGGQVVQL